MSIELTYTILIELGFDHSIGGYVEIVTQYRVGETELLEAVTTAYNAKNDTTVTNDAMADALQSYVDEEHRHLMGFFRAMYHEDNDPIGFHEQAFFDNLEKGNES